MTLADPSGAGAPETLPPAVLGAPDAGADPAEPRGPGRLGALLVREGVVTQPQLNAALEAQRARGDDVPVEEILVEQGAVSREQVRALLRREAQRHRLGDLLVAAGVIDEARLQLAIDHHRRTGLRLGDALLQLGYVTEEELRYVLSRQLAVPFVDIDRTLVVGRLAPLVPKEYAERHRVVPVAASEGILTVAVADPTEAWVEEDLQAATGRRIQRVTSTASAFQRAFARVYGEDPDVGLARQHRRLEEAHAVLARQLEEALGALSDLRHAHDAFVREQAAEMRAAAEKTALEHAAREAALARLTAAHQALQAEHAELRAAHAEHLADYAQLVETQERALDNLAALRREHGALMDDYRAASEALEQERRRAAELHRALADLEERHAALQRDHERVARELGERCAAVETLRVAAIGQIEELLGRLRA